MRADPTSRRPDGTRGGRHRARLSMPRMPFVRVVACGRSLHVVSSGCVGARWFEDSTRMSVAVVVRAALRAYAGGAWEVQGRSLENGERSAK